MIKQVKIGVAVASVALGLMAPGAWAAPWIKAESEHFIIYSDNPEKETTAYLTRLEQYNYLLGVFYGLSADDESVTPKQPLYFVQTAVEMRRTKPGLTNQAGGYFNTGCPEGQIGVAVNLGRMVETSDKAPTDSKALIDQGEDESQTTIFHEYAHSFMFHHTEANYPSWFVEGFAEYYGATKMQGDQVVVGMPQLKQWYALREGFGITYPDMLRSHKAIFDSQETSLGFYTRGWLLTHYLMSDPDRRKRFNDYIVAYDKGEDPVAAFERIMGITMKELPKLLDTYKDNALKATVYRIGSMPVPKIAVSPMPASAANLILLDASVQNCPDSKTGPAILADIRREAAAFPNDDYARIALARAENVIGDEAKALPILKAYTAAHPDDAEAAFLLGQSWYLMTEHKTILAGETRESQIGYARAALIQAYKLDPKNAPNLYYLSLAEKGQPGYPTDTAVDAASQAHALAPSVPDYALQAARLLLQTNHMPEAKEMMMTIASNPHLEEASKWASDIIAAIDAGKSKDEVMKMLDTPIGGAKPATAKPDGK